MGYHTTSWWGMGFNSDDGTASQVGIKGILYMSRGKVV